MFKNLYFLTLRIKFYRNFEKVERKVWVELGKQETSVSNLDVRRTIEAGTSPIHVRETSPIELNSLV
jgi:hypothetical protein